MILFYQPQIGDGVNFLDEDESRHAAKVLRLQLGDSFSITDGKGTVYEASITKITKSNCAFEVIKSEKVAPRGYRIHLAISPTKSIDRMEWLVEKATEIGVDEISFMVCTNSERRNINLERLQKKAISALKQSRQAWLPKLNEIQKFSEVLIFDGKKYIAHLSESSIPFPKDVPLNASYQVLIGPEGDFTKPEIDAAIKNGYQVVTLGNNILRTETAALAACHAIHLRHILT